MAVLNKINEDVPNTLADIFSLFSFVDVPIIDEVEAEAEDRDEVLYEDER